jgi:hypothetical protein
MDGFSKNELRNAYATPLYSSEGAHGLQMLWHPH